MLSNKGIREINDCRDTEENIVRYWKLCCKTLLTWKDCLKKVSCRGTLFAPFWCLCQKLSLSPFTLIELYYTKALSDQASSLAPDWILLLRGPRIPVYSCDSTTTFHLGGSSGILQDKVRMLGALVLCSLSEHVFCCALLTLPCACVNEWQALREASKGPCSAVPQWSHTAYGRNLSGHYTDLPMPRGTQCLLREPTRNGQSVWTELSFLGQTFRSLWPFHNSLGIRSTNLM